MRLYSAFLRFVFHLFYNPFAFTYDFVSAAVSRGRWRVWTHAVIPRIVGTRVLEIPCGTGNLLLDLRAAGYAPIGVDLSRSMLNVARHKFQRTNSSAPILCTRVQALPFPNSAFDSITMTFPSGFVRDPRAFVELRRVLADDGRLIWVDAARLFPCDAWNRVLNRALDAVGGSGMAFEDFAREMLARARFASKVERIQDDASVVIVVIATKEQPE
jgi:ubiquinone/menaquinone biosynthesis C-methylase UbiE